MIEEFDQDFGETIQLPLNQELEFGKFHQNWNQRYIAERFARVTGKGKPGKQGPEWTLSHEGMYEAIEKLCKATKRIAEGRSESAKMDDTGECEFNFYLVYPIIVCSGELYECRVEGMQYRLKRTKMIYLDWSIECQHFQQNYRIHVIHESELANHLRRIASDLKGLRAATRSEYPRIQQSVKAFNLRHDTQPSKDNRVPIKD